ncbi:hypothetical protein [Mycobacterium phage WXIN]|nr:hypothetical protein [Mycobacterium phage WXIN]
MGWLMDEFDRAAERRFKRAILDAREAFAQLPAARQEELARKFQEAADAAMRRATFRGNQ